MLGSSIQLSLLSRRTSKVQLPCLKPRTIATKKSKNRVKTAVLAHADHLQHVIAREQPIRIKRKRSSKYSTAHRLSNNKLKLGYNGTVFILKTKPLKGPIRSTGLFQGC